MPIKRIFFLILISLWVAEPFLSLTALKAGPTHRICRTCGMEDMCGDTCCCAQSKNLCGGVRHGLYSAGCTPDSARNLFFSQGADKFMPQTRPVLFRLDLARRVMVEVPFIPASPRFLFTPPPKLDHFA